MEFCLFHRVKLYIISAVKPNKFAIDSYGANGWVKRAPRETPLRFNRTIYQKIYAVEKVRFMGRLGSDPYE